MMYLIVLEKLMKIIIDVIGLASLIGFSLVGILLFRELEIDSWFFEGLSIHFLIPMSTFIFVYFFEVPLLEKLFIRKKSDWID